MVGLLPHTVLPATSPGTVYHRLSLVGLDSAWQVYSVTLQTLSCQPDQHQQIPGRSTTTTTGSKVRAVFRTNCLGGK